MNNLTNSLLLYIVDFIDPYHCKYLWNYDPKLFIKMAKISKRFYDIIKNTESYQFEHIKVKMREIKNIELIKTKSNDLDIVIPNNQISEAYFYMAYPLIKGYILYDELESYIDNNAKYFIEACKIFNWEHAQESGIITSIIESYERELDILTHKTITIPIRSENHLDQKIMSMTVLKLPLYSYNYMEADVHNTDNSFSVRISGTKKYSDICHFIIDNGYFNQCKRFILKYLTFVRDNPDYCNCPRIESIDSPFRLN
jgi:hypothetical protein